MLHWVKILLKCAGRYLRGSGIEDGLIETKIFGKLTLHSVMEGTHYVRSFQGILIVSDALNSLMWEGFWFWLRQHGRQLYDDVIARAKELKLPCARRARIGQPQSLQSYSNSRVIFRRCFSPSWKNVNQNLRFASTGVCSSKWHLLSSMSSLLIEKATLHCTLYL